MFTDELMVTVTAPTAPGAPTVRAVKTARRMVSTLVPDDVQFNDGVPLVADACSAPKQV